MTASRDRSTQASQTCSSKSVFPSARGACTRAGSALVALAAVAALSACGDYKVEEASSMGEEIFDSSPNTKVKEAGITINRVRVYRGLNPATGPSDLGLRDKYAVEVWFTPDGETVPRYALDAHYLADGDGNLYEAPSVPGEKIQTDSILFDAKGASSFQTWVRDAKTALFRSVPALHTWDTSTTDSAGVQSVTRAQKPAADLDAKLKGRIGSTDFVDSIKLGSDTRTIPTTAKGRLGCMITTTTSSTSGVVVKVDYKFFDVELGAQLVDSDNRYDAGTAGTFGNRKLHSKVKSIWYVVGVNVNARTIQVLRDQTQPFYVSRSAPAKKDATTFVPSGFETLLRECNKASAHPPAQPGTPSTAAQFSLVVFSPATGGDVPTAFEVPDVVSPSTLPYCSEFDTAADQAREFSTLAGTAPGCNAWKTGLDDLESHWDGLKYVEDSSPLTEKLPIWRDVSPIVEVKL